MSGPSPAAGLIERERQRQINEEGWTPEHDDAHDEGTLVKAAWSYYTAEGPDSPPREDWPWDKEWWKPKTPAENLVKAGALAQAELDSLERRYGIENVPADHGAVAILRDNIIRDLDDILHQQYLERIQSDG